MVFTFLRHWMIYHPSVCRHKVHFLDAGDCGFGIQHFLANASLLDTEFNETREKRLLRWQASGVRASCLAKDRIPPSKIGYAHLRRMTAARPVY